MKIIHAPPHDNCYKVTLIGAGPGDPDLLTIKASRAIANADVIIFDHLVSHAIQATFPASAEHIYVGKEKGYHCKNQDEINHLIKDFAETHRNVCRVKGGDAFIFGRGGEEMLFLAQFGIAVDVIPGITAASGCTTYANIPLTHRGLAQGCTLITAHTSTTSTINWQALAALQQTLVIYMGLSKIQWIQSSLLNAAMRPDTPVAIIENGCTEHQRHVYGQLDQLATLASDHQVQSPALLVIGDVVQIATQMIQQPATSPIHAPDIPPSPTLCVSELDNDI